MLRSRFVTVLNGQVHGTLAIPADSVEVCAVLDQDPGNIKMASLGSFRKERVVIEPLMMMHRAMGHHLLDDRNVPASHRVHGEAAYLAVVEMIRVPAFAK